MNLLNTKHHDLPVLNLNANSDLVPTAKDSSAFNISKIAKVCISASCLFAAKQFSNSLMKDPVDNQYSKLCNTLEPGKFSENWTPIANSDIKKIAYLSTVVDPEVTPFEVQLSDTQVKKAFEITENLYNEDCPNLTADDLPSDIIAFCNQRAEFDATIALASGLTHEEAEKYDTDIFNSCYRSQI